MNLYKHPKLREAFDIYVREQNALLPSDEELVGIAFSDEFEARMEKLIRRQKYGYYMLFGTVARRVATIVIALFLGATIVTFSVEALRQPVVRFFTEVFETFTRVIFVDDTSELMQEELEKKTPTYIPDGYVMESKIEVGVVYKITYVNKETGERIYYRQEINNGKTFEMDTEGSGYHVVTLGQSEGVIYKNKGKITLMFTDKQYSYSLYGSVAQEELIEIAESIIL